MELDHLAICAADLDQASAWAEARLGLPLVAGGAHPLFGTHNRLMSLGQGLYLEVIAPDPAAPHPGRPRWFGLDHAGPPVLGNWIARVDRPDLIPADRGDVLALRRDDLAWSIAVPADGSLPASGGLPTVIAWTAGRHPSERLPDCGARLKRLIVRHPEAARLSARVARELGDARVVFEPAARPSLLAVIATPAGDRIL